jgi:hypothetical protein
MITRHSKHSRIVLQVTGNCKHTGSAVPYDFNQKQRPASSMILVNASSMFFNADSGLVSPIGWHIGWNYGTASSWLCMCIILGQLSSQGKPRLFVGLKGKENTLPCIGVWCVYEYCALWQLFRKGRLRSCSVWEGRKQKQTHGILKSHLHDGKFEAQMYTDHTLTRELVVMKLENRQFDTITQ